MQRVYPDYPAFVLERRVNIPPDVAVTACAFVTGDHLTSTDAPSVLRIDQPFRRVGFWPRSGSRARAQLLTRHGWRIAAVELEIAPWSDTATCVSLRPEALRPLRWSGRRMRRYFAAAHEAIDDVRRVLEHRAAVLASSSEPRDSDRRVLR